MTGQHIDSGNNDCLLAQEMPTRSLRQAVSDLQRGNGTDPWPRELERRRAPRLDLPFPATVRGEDPTGSRFEIDTTLDSFSTCGLYLHLPHRVQRGQELLIVVRLSTAGCQAPAPRVGLRGRVARVEWGRDGRCGVAVEFSRHRFLYALVV